MAGLDPWLSPLVVITGLDPVIHVSISADIVWYRGVDGRIKSGHDEKG